MALLGNLGGVFILTAELIVEGKDRVNLACVGQGQELGAGALTVL